VLTFALSQHCHHSSTARTYAIFAHVLLACSERHERFNHKPLQSNYGACLSAAGDKAEFLYSAFADAKMPQFNGSYLVPNIIRTALSYICQKAKTIVVLVVCCFATRAQMASPHGCRQPSASDSIWSSPGAYGRLFHCCEGVGTLTQVSYQVC
jgi:hypothetical protein